MEMATEVFNKEIIGISGRVSACIRDKDFAKAKSIAKEISTLDQDSDKFIEETIQVSRLLTPHDPNYSSMLIENALKKEPNNPDLLYQLGMNHLRKKEHKEALDLQCKVLSLDAEHVPAQCGLAAIYTRQGEIEKAEQILKKAMSNTNQSEILESSVLLQFASLYASPKYLQTHGTAHLFEYTNKILFTPAYRNSIHALFAILYTSIFKNDPKAESQDERFENIFKCHTLLQKGISCFSTKDYGTAIKHLNEAAELIPATHPYPRNVPLFAQIYYRRASALLGDFDEVGHEVAQKRAKLLERALSDYTTSISHDNTFAPSWAGRGEILFEQENYEQALASFETALHHGYSQLAHAYHRLAYLCRKLKKNQKAIDYAQKVLEIDPNHNDAKMEMFASYVQEHPDPEKMPKEAVDLSEEIMKNDPGFQSYFEKNKNRKPDEIIEELNSFVDNNFRPKEDFKVYSSEKFEEDDVQ